MNKIPHKVEITFQDDLREKLDSELAKTHQPLDDYVNEALKNYIADIEWRRVAIDQARAEIDRGEYYSFEEVLSRIDGIIAKTTS